MRSFGVGWGRRVWVLSSGANGDQSGQNDELINVDGNMTNIKL